MERVSESRIGLWESKGGVYSYRSPDGHRIRVMPTRRAGVRDRPSTLLYAHPDAHFVHVSADEVSAGLLPENVGGRSEGSAFKKKSINREKLLAELRQQMAGAWKTAPEGIRQFREPFLEYIDQAVLAGTVKTLPLFEGDSQMDRKGKTFENMFEAILRNAPWASNYSAVQKQKILDWFYNR